MKKRECSLICGIIASLFFILSVEAFAAEKNYISSLLDQFSQSEIHGYSEVRSGYRLQNDQYENDMSVMETRLQMECSTYTDMFDFKYKGDVWGDLVTEKAEYDTRELWIFSRLNDFIDIKVGRQVLTWGTGDLVFLNDLFPKDWQSYFIGRDSEYLKAPSDSLKLSLFPEVVNIDFVYTPQFDADRYITGEYISHWNSTTENISGRNAIVYADEPDDWFEDDEFAMRVYKNIQNYEYAIYGYWGFWKTPVGKTLSGIKTFPDLNVYGASVRGGLGKGIGNVEIAYYDSANDRNGSNVLVKNSEIKYLLGYTQDIAKDCNLSVQYYVEQMMDFDNYKSNLTRGRQEDRFRHVMTVQATKLLMNQNLELSLPLYYSLSDKDAYLRPHLNYKYTDQISFELGANIFFGDDERTFFSQLEKNTNVYSVVRYHF